MDRRGTRSFEKGAFSLARDQSRTKSDGARTLPVINPRQTEDLFIGSRRTINGDRRDRAQLAPRRKRGNVMLKRHIDGERDALSAYLAGRAAGQRSSERLVRVLGIGEGTEIVERLVLRPGVRVRDIEEP